MTHFHGADNMELLALSYLGGRKDVRMRYFTQYHSIFHIRDLVVALVPVRNVEQRYGLQE